MSTFPITVEIGLGQAPTTASPTWTDVSAYVLTDAINIVRGTTSGERLEPQPGEATFTLLNTDRRFDPANASGPYYGDLTPRCPVRISITATGSKTLFRGFIDGGWNQSWNGERRLVEVHALDGLGWMAGITAPDSAWDQFVLASDAVQWFRNTGPEVVEQFTGDRLGATYLGPRDDVESCIAGRDTTVKRGAEYRGTMDTTGESAIVWFRISPDEGEVIDEDAQYYVWLYWVDEVGDAGIRSGTSIMNYGLASGWRSISVYRKQHSDATRSNTQTAACGDYDGTYGTIAQQSLQNGEATMIGVEALAVDATSQCANIYLNGTARYALAATSPGVHVGTSQTMIFGHVGMPWLAVEEVVILPEATTTDMSEAYRVGRYGWEDETIGDRISRLVTLSDWPLVGDIDLTTGLCGDLYQGGGRPVLDHLRDMAAADLGHLHTLRTGEVVFDCRDNWWTERTASITAIDDPAYWNASAGWLPVSRDMSPILYDDRRLTNVASVAREGGTPQVARDAASITAYGEKSTSTTVDVYSDAEARRLADWTVLVGAEPRARIEQLVFKPRRLAGMDAKIAAAELGDYVATVVDGGNIGAYVVGITHDFSGSDWTATLHVDSSFALNQGSWGAWGTSNADSTGSNGKWAADAAAAIWAP